MLDLFKRLLPIVKEPEEDDEPVVHHMDYLDHEVELAIKTLEDPAAYKILLEESKDQPDSHDPVVGSVWHSWELNRKQYVKPDDFIWEKDLDYIEIAGMCESKHRSNTTITFETFFMLVNQARRAMALYRALSEPHRIIDRSKKGKLTLRSARDIKKMAHAALRYSDKTFDNWATCCKERKKNG